MIIESEGSGDEYKDEDGPESESESEVDEQQEEPKSTNVKGRKSGRTDIAAMRKTGPAAGTPDIDNTAIGGNNKRKITDSGSSDVKRCVTNSYSLNPHRSHTVTITKV